VVGEAIQQVLSGSGFVAGRTYRVTLCIKNAIIPDRIPYVQYKARASNNALTTPSDLGGGEVIGTTGHLAGTSFVTVTLPDWSPGSTYSRLTLSPENHSSINNGDSTSAGAIDNVCIQDVTMPTSISVSPESLSFGNVSVGSSKEDSVSIINTGTNPLSIASVTSTLSEFVVTPTNGTLAAGDSVKFFITFTPTSVGTKDGSIVFTSNAATSPDTVAVSGTAPLFGEVFSGSLDSTWLSSVVWGDYDNDGRLDILLTGHGGGNSRVAKIYRNNGSGFSEVYPGSLTPVYYGAARGVTMIMMACWTSS